MYENVDCSLEAALPLTTKKNEKALILYIQRIRASYAYSIPLTEDS
jgi:hypothetical protein